MEAILSSSRLAVLLNGTPGPWISWRRGLRQGDALSLYLFVMVADLLQRLSKEDGSFRHLLIDGPCAVLQYADDTLILFRADSSNAIQL